MGLFSGIGNAIVSGFKGIVNTVKNAKIGKAAIQAGFTIKGGADTDAAKAKLSVFQSIPWYVWGIAVAFLLLLFSMASGGRR